MAESDSNSNSNSKLREYRERFAKGVYAVPKSSGDSALWRGKESCPALDVWHDCVGIMTSRPVTGAAESRAKVMLANILHDDVVFHPPTYWKSRYGKNISMLILTEVCKIFESFTYHRQFVDGSRRQACLEFSAIVDGIACQGVDMITFDRDCESGSNVLQKIIDFKVMIRPPEAALYLKSYMSRRIKEVLSNGGKL